MKVIVAGGRNITDYTVVRQAIEKSCFNITQIVSGGARGVDFLGEHYAHLNDLGLKIFPANWSKFGKSAGYIRNSEMADYADALIAVWDGESKGTGHMVDLARKKDLQSYVHMVKQNEN